MASRGIAEQVLVNGGLEKDDESIDPIHIERHLDQLTLSGSTINDLELKLMQMRELYRKTLEDCRRELETTRRALHTHIVKSEPFVDVWRRARQIQEASNRAAAKYDKANSQYSAAKEMIRVAEEKLSIATRDQPPTSPSALDLAWQEMLNHATRKVFETEMERRVSELEHKRILQECQVVMEEYRITERKLRSHITKSRPFYELRYECNRKLQQIKRTITDLETKVKVSKATYSRTLKNLEALNKEIHERRRSSSVLLLRGSHVQERHRSQSANNLKTHREDQRLWQSASTETSPTLQRKAANGQVLAESLESLQLGDLQGQYSGSTASLPSPETSSMSDATCPTPDVNSTPARHVPEIRLQPDKPDCQVIRDLVAEVLQRAANRLSAELTDRQDHSTVDH